MFGMEADTDGIRTAVASDGRVDGGDDDVQIVAKFLLQLAFGLSDDVEGV